MSQSLDQVKTLPWPVGGLGKSYDQEQDASLSGVRGEIQEQEELPQQAKMREEYTHMKRSTISSPTPAPLLHPSRQRLEYSSSWPVPGRGHGPEHCSYARKPAGCTSLFLFFPLLTVVSFALFAHILNHLLKGNFSCPDLCILVSYLNSNEQKSTNLPRCIFNDLALLERKPWACCCCLPTPYLCCGRVPTGSNQCMMKAVTHRGDDSGASWPFSYQLLEASTSSSVKRECCLCC